MDTYAAMRTTATAVGHARPRGYDWAHTPTNAFPGVVRTEQDASRGAGDFSRAASDKSRPRPRAATLGGKAA